MQVCRFLVVLHAFIFLKVLTGALVSRIIFEDTAPGTDLTATGIEFIAEDQLYTVYVHKEVILSAG